MFRLQSHLDRLFNSMKLVRMTPPSTREELTAAIVDLLRANRAREDTYIMPVAYFSGDVAGYMAAYEQPGAVYIVARPSASNLGSNRGSHCCVSSWTRISDNVLPPRAKMLSNYENSRLVSTEARINGYDAGIILNPEGKVAEGLIRLHLHCEGRGRHHAGRDLRHSGEHHKGNGDSPVQGASWRARSGEGRG